MILPLCKINLKRLSNQLAGSAPHPKATAKGNKIHWCSCECLGLHPLRQPAMTPRASNPSMYFPLLGVNALNVADDELRGCSRRQQDGGRPLHATVLRSSAKRRHECEKQYYVYRYITVCLPCVIQYCRVPVYVTLRYYGYCIYILFPINIPY